MRAITYTEYGSPDVLHLTEVDRPEPGQGEVLVRTHAASVNFSDPTFVQGKPFVVRLMGAGLLKPKNPIRGADVAGRVEAVGEGVTRFTPGAAVFGDISDSGYGGFAEFVCAPEQMLAPMPAELSFEEAAAVPQAAVTALQGLRDAGQLKAGQQVLVNGASGGIGTFAVQIAKSFGANVTGVCSTKSVEMVREIGADRVIDYTREDFTKGDTAYDLVFDIVAKKSVSEYLRVVRTGGSYVACAFNPSSLFLGPLLSKIRGKQVRSLVAKSNTRDLEFIAELLQSGKIRPVIGKRYPLSEASDAVRYYAERHARGKVVITIADENRS